MVMARDNRPREIFVVFLPACKDIADIVPGHVLISRLRFNHLATII